ncbi:MAG: DsbA family protein [Gammaproteobacteria bacterium]|nr:DsbA family protein [Gammaproteobacteria bacterium]
MRLNDSINTLRNLASIKGLALLAVLASGPVAAAPAPDVLGSIDGEPITLEQVEASAAVELRTVDLEFARKRHETLELALGQYMAERLLDIAAAEQGSTREKLLDGLSAGSVSDADIDEFYEANKSRIQGSKEQLKEKIRQYLSQQGMQAAYAEYLSGLQKRYKAETFMQPFRMPVDAIGPSLGNKDAPVTLVEFSDFQCPYCVTIYPVLQEMVKTYGDKVRLVYRQFPLDIHDKAREASEASLCADEQDRFWDMHNSFFNHQQALRGGGITNVAEGMNLDMKAFNECMQSGRSAARVDRDMRDAQVLGVTGTPATFVNGRMVSGAVGAQQLKAMIDEELARPGR